MTVPLPTPEELARTLYGSGHEASDATSTWVKVTAETIRERDRLILEWIEGHGMNPCSVYRDGYNAALAAVRDAIKGV